MDPTEVEEGEYDSFLREQDRPPIIDSPVFPQTQLEWHGINTNVHQNLKCFLCTVVCKIQISMRRRNTCATRSTFSSPMEQSVVSEPDQILPIPYEAINGYKWDESSRAWPLLLLIEMKKKKRSKIEKFEPCKTLPLSSCTVAV